MKAKALLLTLTVVMIVGVLKVTRPNKNVRNDNPLNIEKGADWDGLRATQTDDRFAQFVSPDYGFRAGYIILTGYLMRGQDTIETIIAGIDGQMGWAPESDNGAHTYHYIDYLANKLEMSPVETVTPENLPLLMLHMADFEGAKGAYNIDVVMQGVLLAQQETRIANRLIELGAAV